MPSKVPTLTTADLRGKEGMHKFVRIGDEFRFLEVADIGPRHKDMLGEEEKCAAAGTIFINPEKSEWYMDDPYSSSLRIGAMEKDYRDLAFVLAQLGLQERDK